MSRRLVLVEEVALELGHALETYDAAAALEAAFVRTVERIVEATLSFPAVRGAPEFRWALVPRFLFKVYFEVTDEQIRVLAFAHPKRRPLYWKK